MQARPTFCGEADFERWLSSALKAESQRLKLQVMPRAPRPPTQQHDQVHALRQGDTT